ncbi:TVP38/TMEM64 family protein [Halopseudomonas salegens]|uniref:TVP38/TMEM64 family membrane protein n=1 Tax=Halopseudomonas salegens TaxID=1434072 RepID=A0A1H2DXG9_9GAMM|nr:VTT domain-containing protein [Halopseudomonas salegens]SDT87527.1 Uncharacterized membrane protein YdjX, TVP38/TMEM64 family, SNARE-associated domain [Halopseudomonas salegens]
MPGAVKRLILAVVVLLAMALLWRYLIDIGWISAEKLKDLLLQASAWQQSIWLLPALIVLYVVSLSIMFPLTLLVVATGFLFDPLWAILYASIGSLASSAVSYFIGHYLGREAIDQHGNGRIKRVGAFMQSNTAYSMIVINLLPIAPFTMTNMLAGAFNMRFLPYMIGSAIGLIPGLVAVILLGGQLGRILLASESEQVWQALAVAAVVIVALAVIIYLTNRRVHLDE